MKSIDAAKAESIARKELEAIASRQQLEVIDGDQFPDGRRQPMLYGGPEGFPCGCWIIYLEPRGDRLESSQIIVISKSSGQIVYSGSAYDEG